MVTGEGVAAYIRLPVCKTGCPAKGAPAVLPISGNEHRYVLQSIFTAKRYYSSSSRLTAAGGDNDNSFRETDVLVCQTTDFLRPNAAVKGIRKATEQMATTMG